jgi:hypothetical protein
MFAEPLSHTLVDPSFTLPGIPFDDVPYRASASRFQGDTAIAASDQHLFFEHRALLPI